MATVLPRQVVARNSASKSDNKIHDDEVARTYGFSGGLVPGVDVYAYAAHVPAREWGREWLERGTLAARFEQPVYEGEVVTVVATAGEPDTTGALVLDLEVRTDAGGRCATARATLPAAAPTPPDPGEWPVVDPPDPAAERTAAAPETLVPGTALALVDRPLDAGQARTHLDLVGEDLALFTADGYAHPGWLLRRANYVLSRNRALGPWIHVESDVQHHAAVRVGQPVATRAVVRDEWERKGHRFVALDVLLVTEGEQPVARIAHTAIYAPRTGEP